MACSGSSPNLSASSWSTFKDCITAAVDGDTITLAGGAYNADSQAYINGKYVKVVCSGTCTITDNFCAGVCNSGPTDSTIRILGNSVGATEFGGPGFVFEVGTSIHSNPSAYIYAADGGSKPIKLLGGTVNDFEGGFIHGEGDKGVVDGFTITGLVYYYESPPGSWHCENNHSFFRNGSDGTTGWTSISKFGSADTNQDYKWYIQNNTIIKMNEALDNNSGGRQVIRFNTFNNAAIITHGADTQYYGGRYSEIYGNTFIRDNTLLPECDNSLDMNGQGFIGLRGGTAIIVKNVIPNATTAAWGPKSAVTMYWENLTRPGSESGGEWACWGNGGSSPYSGDPGPFMLGWGWINGSTAAGNSGWFLDREPIIVAANTSDGNQNDMWVGDYDSSGALCSTSERAVDYVQINEEWYQQAANTEQTTQSSPFTGANAGTGFGTWANRPTSCTNGRYYWATDQGGHWQTKNLDGTPNVEANNGALYKCASNNWDLFYVPSDYPGPWISGSVAGRRVKVHPPHRRKRV